MPMFARHRCRHCSHVRRIFRGFHTWTNSLPHAAQVSRRTGRMLPGSGLGFVCVMEDYASMPSAAKPLVRLVLGS